MAKPKTPKCAWCRASLRGARTVIESKWCCPDCAYRYDHPGMEIPTFKRERRKINAPPQEESLFPLPARRAD